MLSKTKQKSWLMVLLMLVISLMLFAFSGIIANAEEQPSETPTEAQIVASGSCGDDLTWELGFDIRWF